MPPKRKAEPVFQRCQGVAEGWRFDVYNDGVVQVGTAKAGQQFGRWTFRLTSKTHKELHTCTDDRAACVRAEVTKRQIGPGPLPLQDADAAEPPPPPAEEEDDPNMEIDDVSED